MSEHECDCEKLRQVLTRLVNLKDGPKDSMYLREKPKAWADARRVLGKPEPWDVV